MNICLMKRAIVIPSMIVLLGGGLLACGDGNDNRGGAASDQEIQFRCLGQAGTTDNGGIVNDGGRFDLSPPYSLKSATAGVSLSMFPPVTEFLGDVDFQVNFTTRRHPPTECSTGTSPGGGGFGERIPVRIAGRDGIGVTFSQADLVGIVNFLKTFPAPDVCADVRPRDLLIDSVVVFRHPDTGGEFIGLDGLAIGRDATMFPTPATTLPSCLRP